MNEQCRWPREQWAGPLEEDILHAHLVGLLELSKCIAHSKKLDTFFDESCFPSVILSLPFTLLIPFYSPYPQGTEVHKVIRPEQVFNRKNLQVQSGSVTSELGCRPSISEHWRV